MEENQLIENDYKKWILYNDSLQDFQNLYDLYSAVRSRMSYGKVAYQADAETITVRQEGVSSPLIILLEKQDEFLKYLEKHYFSNEDIEEWYKNKAQDQDRASNSSLKQTKKPVSHSKPHAYKVHRKESIYYKVRLFFSLVTYIGIIGLLAASFIKSTTEGLISLTMIGVLVLIFWFAKRIVQGFLIGMIKGNAIKVHDNQYPEIYDIVKQQAEQIGLKEIPETYIAAGRFNAFVTMLARKKYLLLFSEIAETASKGDFEVLKFVVGHELGHLQRRHLTRETWLWPSLFIPFLKAAHSRGCEYTCDRIGYHFSPQGATEGILILSAGKEIYSKFDADQFVQDTEGQHSFWMSLSEKFLSHPHTAHRLVAIKKYDEVGY